MSSTWTFPLEGRRTESQSPGAASLDKRPESCQQPLHRRSLPRLASLDTTVKRPPALQTPRSRPHQHREAGPGRHGATSCSRLVASAALPHSTRPLHLHGNRCSRSPPPQTLPLTSGPSPPRLSRWVCRKPGEQGGAPLTWLLPPQLYRKQQQLPRQARPGGEPAQRAGLSAAPQTCPLPGRSAQATASAVPCSPVGTQAPGTPVAELT